MKIYYGPRQELSVVMPEILTIEPETVGEVIVYPIVPAFEIQYLGPHRIQQTVSENVPAVGDRR